MATFTVVDYIALFGMLLASSAIGVYYGFVNKKKKSTTEFLLGGRQMTLLPVTFSLLATYVSATTILGFTSEVYVFGSQQTLIVVSFVFLYPLVGYMFLPVYYNLEITSVNEYLEMRFDKTIRKIAGIIYIIQTVLYLSVIIYSPAIALIQVTGMSFWTAISIIVGVCTFYTTLGGIRAVMWTDVLQCLILIIVVLIITIQGWIVVGGSYNIFHNAYKGQRMEISFSVDPRVRHTFWTHTFAYIFIQLSVNAVSQAQVQRYLAANSITTAKRAIMGNVIGWIWISLSTTVIAFIMYAHYLGCDPVLEGRITRHEQLLPLFASHILEHIPGFSGLFMAGLVGGALSTLSTGLNSLSAVTFEDFIKAFSWGQVSDRKGTIIVKLLALGYGILCLLCINLIRDFSTVTEAAISALGLLGGPLLGVFVLGMFFPWANSLGATVGTVSSLGLALWFFIGPRLTYQLKPTWLPLSVSNCSMTSFHNNMTNNATINPVAYNATTIPNEIEPNQMDSSLKYFYSISYMWYCPILTCTVIVIGLVLSFLTGPLKASNLDRNLFSPFALWVMDNLPTKLKTPSYKENKTKLTNEDGDAIEKYPLQEHPEKT